MTTPGRLAAAPRGGTEPDRGTRIGFGPPRRSRAPLVAYGDRSPAGDEGKRFVRRGSRAARWSN
jgi:hypothetical protein